MTGKCLACGAQSVRRFMSYGMLPLGNNFLRNPNFNEDKFHIQLGVCWDCRTVQQLSPPPFEKLREDYENYSYAPSRSSTAQVKNLQTFGPEIAEFCSLNRNSLWVDIGSNDGVLLASIKDKCRVLGIEPAKEISQLAIQNGVPIINDFFNRSTVDKIISEHGKADVVSATQVMQHMTKLPEFVRNVDDLLKEGGTLVIEGRDFGATLATNAYDTIYPEMITYPTLSGLKNVLAYAGLITVRAEKVGIYGGSLRVFAKKGKASPDESVSKITEYEVRSGMNTMKPYNAFARNAFKLRDQLVSVMETFRNHGTGVAAWGASSTFTTLINFCKLDTEYVQYVIDDSPLKQGKFVPGTHQPIYPKETLKRKTVEAVLVGAWRLRGEIEPKIKEYKIKKIVFPLPRVDVVEQET